MNETIIGVAEAQPFQLLLMYEWGLTVIRAIQQVQSPALTALMRFISALGSELLYAPAILFTLWCLDEKRGFRFGVLLIISVWINIFLKDTFAQPRPFVIDPSVGIGSTSGYSLPSAHAQLAVCFWIHAAAQLSAVFQRRTRAIWAAAISMILLISFSRVYLGVHYPTDILAGWIAGSLVLALFFAADKVFARLQARAQTRVRSQTDDQTDAQVGAAQARAAQARVQGRLPGLAAAVVALAMNELSPHGRAFSALFLGFCFGSMLMKQRFPFSARGEIGGQKPGVKIILARCCLGLVSTAALFLALRLIAPGESSLLRNIPAWGANSPFLDIGKFARYALVALWVAAGAPRLFQRLGLAKGAAPE